MKMLAESLRTQLLQAAESAEPIIDGLLERPVFLMAPLIDTGLREDARRCRR